MMLLDTSFLIDLQREWVREQPGVATSLLRTNDTEEFAISVVAAIEFLEGYDTIREGEKFLEPYRWIDVTPGVARTASRIRRTLRQNGTIIGDFDILIAATSLELEARLVAADTGHFEVVEGLQLESYR
jgi:predicted nucleic acid-binding protein